MLNSPMTVTVALVLVGIFIAAAYFSRGNQADGPGNGPGEGAGGASTSARERPSEPRRDPLREVIRDCDGSADGCVKDVVARIAPEAEYVGGRTDAGGSGQNNAVLYFADPDMEPCEYTRFTHAPTDRSALYTVVIAGEDSFGEEGGRDGCVPES